MGGVVSHVLRACRKLFRQRVYSYVECTTAVAWSDSELAGHPLTLLIGCIYASTRAAGPEIRDSQA